MYLMSSRKASMTEKLGLWHNTLFWDSWICNRYHVSPRGEKFYRCQIQGFYGVHGLAVLGPSHYHNRIEEHRARSRNLFSTSTTLRKYFDWRKKQNFQYHIGATSVCFPIFCAALSIDPQNTRFWKNLKYIVKCTVVPTEHQVCRLRHRRRWRWEVANSPHQISCKG